MRYGKQVIELTLEANDQYVLMLGLFQTVSAEGPSGSEEILLVRDGKPNATVVVAENPI